MKLTLIDVEIGTPVQITDGTCDLCMTTYTTRPMTYTIEDNLGTIHIIDNTWSDGWTVWELAPVDNIARFANWLKDVYVEEDQTVDFHLLDDLIDAYNEETILRTPAPTAPVAQFMEDGGQTVPSDYDPEVSNEELFQFTSRVLDEAEETITAIADNEPADILDGFIDTAFAALTGAIRLVGQDKAQQAWEAVCKANNTKVDGSLGDPIIDPATGKIGKPEGWTAPDIEGIIFQ